MLRLSFEGCVRLLIEYVVVAVAIGYICSEAFLVLTRDAAVVRTHPAVHYSNSFLTAEDSVLCLLATSAEMAQKMSVENRVAVWPSKEQMDH